MKKIFTLAIAAVFALSAAAANGFQDFGKLNRDAHKQLKTINLANVVGKNVKKTKSQAAANAPESIVGKSYITVYNDTENKFNGYFTVVANGENIKLEGFAEGYDVEATYDAATGKITIPTGVVIGKSQTYGDITIHAIVEGGKVEDSEITGIVDGNKVTFDKGLYGTVVYNGEQGGLIIVNEPAATEANGKMSFTLGTDNYECPLQVTKTADNTLSIVGINTLFMPGYFYNVPVTFDAATKVATLKSETPIGHAIASNGTGVKNVYYMFKITTDGLERNPSFSITTTGNTSAITAGSDVFLGYDTNGAGSYRGYTMSNFKFEISYDVLTSAVEDDPYADPTSATVDAITYSLDNEANTAEVTGCLGSVTDLDIPATITANGKTYTVTSVAAQAFYGNRTLKSVHIPASVKAVGQDAFRNLSNLKSLYIADMAAWCAIEFYNGNANPLYNLFSSYSESKWGNVYVNGVAATDIAVPEGVEKIGRAFYGFKAMTNVTLPSTLKELGDQAFANCTKLTSVTIPGTVEKIGSSFWSCEGLTEISIPASVKTLAGSTFYGCKNLKTVALSEGLETIGKMTFSGCKAIEEITIPATVTSIQLMAFYGCTGIKKITSLNTVPPTCAGDGMFEDFLTATLYVPATAVDDYKVATSWKEFTNIEGIVPASIDGVENGNANARKEYYNLQGMKVSAGNITSGIYIIREGSKTTKAYVNAK